MSWVGELQGCCPGGSERSSSSGWRGWMSSPLRASGRLSPSWSTMCAVMGASGTSGVEWLRRAQRLKV